MEDMKKKHETSLQVTKNYLMREAKSIELKFNHEMSAKKQQFELELERLKAQHSKQTKELTKVHTNINEINISAVPELVEMDLTLKQLVRDKKYSDVKYLKRLKEQKQKELLIKADHKLKEALRNKLAVLKSKQSTEVKILRDKFEEFMSEKKLKKEQNLVQHRKSSKVKMLNTCSSNIREFNSAEKKVRQSTIDNKKPVESKYKYYGSDIKTRSLLKSRQVRNTFVLDLIKKA